MTLVIYDRKYTLMCLTFCREKQNKSKTIRVMHHGHRSCMQHLTVLWPGLDFSHGVSTGVANDNRRCFATGGVGGTGIDSPSSAERFEV